MKTMKIAVCGILLVALAGVAAAATPEKGTNLLAFQFSEGSVDLVDVEGGTGYLTSANFVTHPELGGLVQWSYFLTDEYAISVSGGIGYFSESDKPGTNALPADPDRKYTQTSWQARVGGDRYAHINDRFSVFAGPGIQVWSGKWKYEAGTTTQESQNALRIALQGRFGVHVRWNESVGMFAHLGHYLGRVSAEENGAKTSWWASGRDGAGGVAVSF